MKVRQRRPRDTGSVVVRKRKDGSKSFMLKWRTVTETVPAATLEEARALLPAFVARAQAGHVEAERAADRKRNEQPTLSAWSEVFLAQHVTQAPDRLATRAAYTKALHLYVLPDLGKKRLHEITTPVVREMVQKHHANGRAVATLKLACAVLRLAFTAAIEDGYQVSNPVPQFSKFKLGEGRNPADRARDAVLSSAQIEALMTAPLAPELKLYAALLISCGLRRGECVGLRWEDLDLKNGVLHVRRAAKIVRMKGEAKRVWLGKPKTGSSIRTLGIGPNLVAMLRAERERQEGIQRTVLGRDPNVRELRSLLPPDACVFPEGSEGDALRRPADPKNLSDRFKVAAGKLGLNTWSHALRHTSISHAIQGGASLAEAASAAGHASVQTTARVYVHDVSEGKRKVSLIGDGLLTAVPSGERSGNDDERDDGTQVTR